MPVLGASLTPPRAAARRRRRRRLLSRLVPLVVIGGAAFAGGIVLALGSGRAERRLVTRYLIAWRDHDYARMYAMLSPASRHGLSETRFAADYARAAQTATIRALRVVRVSRPSGDAVSARLLVSTRLFGTLDERIRVPVDADGTGIHFGGELVFPGLRPGESLHRHTALGTRGSLLAADGTPLAEGPARTSPIPTVAEQIVGTLGPIPADERASYRAQGYPADAKVGQDGLELVFQRQLAGRAGGTLLAGRRVLADTSPRPGRTVKTTIDPSLEQAVLSALGNSYAGMVVMSPRTGAILAAVGLAWTDVQPPGSTMKIITASAVLTAGLATPSTSYPYATSATIDGYTLGNANGESCGGTLLYAFATSCNSVYAPLGAELGATRLVGMAQRFGFDETPSIPGALASTIPPVATIGNATSVGSSAIGQGEVQASVLEMTDAAATIADAGRRPIPTLQADQPPRTVAVVSRTVASEVQQMMVAVITEGTGTPAQISGVEVAGKTGTAELRTTQGPGAVANSDNPKNTDSWFVAYAPVGHPEYAVGALFPGSGAGAATAAPAVRQVLITALASH